MGKKTTGPQNTVQVRLDPTPEQATLLMAQAQEYIQTVNVLVQACPTTSCWDHQVRNALWDTRAHDTPKSWGLRPQKQPHEQY